MFKKLIQFATVLLCTVILQAVVVSAADSSDTQILRIGLNYNTTTLPGGNLLNQTGSGYRFGFYGDDKLFYQLAYTDETAVSVVKTQNVYYGYLSSQGRNGYSDQITSDISVGCYHVQLPGTYVDFESAKLAVSGYNGGFVAWIDGTFYGRVGNYLNSAAASEAATSIVGGTVAATTSKGVSVVVSGTSKILFQFDHSTLYLGVAPGIDTSVKTKTWFSGYTYYGGFQYGRLTGGDLTIVNFVDIEDYTKGVIPYEMSASWPLEALKAQSVSARTYGAINLNKHSRYGFDLCTTVDCQVYRGTNSSTDHTDQAVDETAGKYAWYDGKLAGTYYYSCNGGASEDVKNVWGSDVPYLKGVVDPYEPSVGHLTNRYNWTFTFTKAELKQILHNKGYICGDITNFYVSERTAMGNVYKITFEDVNGKSWSFVNTKSEYCRTLLGLYSINYSISSGDVSAYVNNEQTVLSNVASAYAIDGSGNTVAIGGSPYMITSSGVSQMPEATASDSYTITGSGWGHAVGMSQWGAYAMAEQGKTYDEILKFYFTGIDVE